MEGCQGVADAYPRNPQPPTLAPNPPAGQISKWSNIIVVKFQTGQQVVAPAERQGSAGRKEGFAVEGRQAVVDGRQGGFQMF